MASNLRFSEKWFNRGLWLVALLFAYFLIGLGGTIVGDLPKIESKLSVRDFVDQPASAQLNAQLKTLERDEQALNDKLERSRLELQAARADYEAARQSFDAWTSTRNSTQRPDQDSDLIARTQQLETLRQAERARLTNNEALSRQLLGIRQSQGKAYTALAALEEAANSAYQSTRNRTELRIFLYRLSFVLPLLLVAGYLFVKHRKKSYWPFVWGFVFFSLFAFFVELVPYLPSYGGYVRYTVGVVLTLIGGKYASAALQRYMERQRELEKLPESERKQDIHYDVALNRIAKSICPGCERPISKDTDNFCQHCGIGIFEKCPSCSTRKTAFSKFCFNCGDNTVKPTDVQAHSV